MAKRGIPAKKDYFHVVLPRLKQVEEMIKHEYTAQEIADFLGVNVRTYYKWKQHYTELQLLHSDIRVQNIAKLKISALKEALGYDTTDIMVETIREVNEDGSLGRITYQKERKTKKRIRGNSQLLVFLLCNWAPDEFKRQDTEDIIKTLQVFMSKEVKDVYGE